MMRDRDPEHIPAACKARDLAYLAEKAHGERYIELTSQMGELSRRTGWSFDAEEHVWIFTDVIPDRSGARAYPAHRDDSLPEGWEGGDS